MTPNIYKQLALLGNEFTSAYLTESFRLFAPLAAKPDPKHGRILSDQVYGIHERHRIDLYGVQPADAKRPVVIYIHGGAFVAGSKQQVDSPFYSNIGAWASANGMIAAIPNYRLAPEFPYPAGRDDVLTVIEWLHAHAVTFGGDPNNIWLLGQSAGAAHVADAIAELTRNSASHKVAGAMMLSGLYDAPTSGDHSGTVAYYGADLAARTPYSSLSELLHTPIPCLFTISELDVAIFHTQASILVAAYVAAHGKWPRMHWLPHHNHFSPVLALGVEAEDDVGPLLLRFMQEHSVL